MRDGGSSDARQPPYKSMNEKLDALRSAIIQFAKERDWDQFHSPKNLAMAMSVEAAEIVEIFQ